MIKYKTPRMTFDIDLIYLEEKNREQRYTKIYQKLAELNMSPEQVNSAALYYLKTIPEWEKHTIILKESANSKILIPTLNLFIALKLKRATDIDIQDCKGAIKNSDEDFCLKTIAKLSLISLEDISNKLTL